MTSRGSASGRCVPVNSAGVIPTTVSGTFAIVITRPMTCGSAAKRERQYRSLSTTTGDADAASSLAWRVRPARAFTPSIEK